MIDAANLYVKLKQWELAAVYYQRVITEYSDTPAASEAELGFARMDAKRGHRADALQRYKSIETHYDGQPVAKDAARERAQLEKSKSS